MERDDDDDVVEFSNDVGDTEDGGRAGWFHSSSDDASSDYLSTDTEPIADSFPEATVMVFNIAGFTDKTARHSKLGSRRTIAGQVSSHATKHTTTSLPTKTTFGYMTFRDGCTK